jgi:hypothetical protein
MHMCCICPTVPSTLDPVFQKGLQRQAFQNICETQSFVFNQATHQLCECVCEWAVVPPLHLTTCSTRLSLAAAAAAAASNTNHCHTRATFIPAGKQTEGKQTDAQGTFTSMLPKLPMLCRLDTVSSHHSLLHV